MWIIYALLCAFFAATTDPIAKNLLKHDSDEYLVGWLSLLASLPFLALFYFSHEIAPVSPELIRTILAVLPFEILATILYYRALKMTDISLSVPFIALTPAFLMLTAFLLLGERIRLMGAFGIILITAGVYSLNLKEAKYGFVNPIKVIISNRGSLYMALVALIFSVTSALSKKAMLNSSPESIPLIYVLSVTLAMLPIILYRLKKRYSVLKASPRAVMSYVSLGLFSAASSIFYFKSVSLAKVAYVISLKRTSLLMSVAYGWIFFRERDIRIRFFSTFCMFLGIVLIVMSQ